MRAKRETLACFREDRSAVNAHRIQKMANEEPTSSLSLIFFFFLMIKEGKGSYFCLSILSRALV